jgi:hypothetical protein
LDVVQITIQTYFEKYKQLVMKMDQATKLKLIDQRYELKTELEKLVQTMHKNFGPHKM